MNPAKMKPPRQIFKIPSLKNKIPRMILHRVKSKMLGQTAWGITLLGDIILRSIKNNFLK
jgi:hypothetical protein